MCVCSWWGVGVRERLCELECKDLRRLEKELGSPGASSRQVGWMWVLGTKLKSPEKQCGLNKSRPHRLIYLNAYSSGSGGTCHWGWALGFQKPMPDPQDEDVSSQLPFQYHACCHTRCCDNDGRSLLLTQAPSF